MTVYLKYGILFLVSKKGRTVMGFFKGFCLGVITFSLIVLLLAFITWVVKVFGTLAMLAVLAVLTGVLFGFIFKDWQVDN